MVLRLYEMGCTRSPYVRGLLAISLFLFIIMIGDSLLKVGSKYTSKFKLRSELNVRVMDFFHPSDYKLSRALLNVTTNEIQSQKKLALPHTTSNSISIEDKLPTIYVVTPTYRRAEMIPELTRTCQTLKWVKNLVWLVVEDSPKPSEEVITYLNKCGIRYHYMRAQMPDKFKSHKNKPRGVANRNAGIEYVRANATEGVVYFGDDDNTYDIQIFEEMRWTKKVSMFPVGLVTKMGLSTPIVKDGKVIDYYDGWIAKRKFPVDMAGFAVSVKLFKQEPNCTMPYKVGYEEDGLLQCLKITKDDIEPKAKNCTEILVWHTQTKKNSAVSYLEDKIKIQGTNLQELKDKLWKGS